MKIAICTPVHGDPKLVYTRSLVHMCVATERAGKAWPLMFEYLTASGPNLAAARTDLVKAARQIGAEWILWIDADQMFPQDTMLRLIARKERVVGANYIARDGSRLPTARDLASRPLATTPDKAGTHLVEPCGALGLGLVLMDIKVFDEIEAPWFDTGWDAAGAPVSESAFFFARLRAANIPVHVDHGLSAKTGHVAEQVLTHEGALQERIREGAVRSRVTGAAAPTQDPPA
ncbi:MAG TPA: hypothetical protein VMG08_04970 [Allosphingosinicella sp.]|nr:hypothetical protein [Allosphingosinicella sp.]